QLDHSDGSAAEVGTAINRFFPIDSLRAGFAIPGARRVHSSPRKATRPAPSGRHSLYYCWHALSKGLPAIRRGISPPTGEGRSIPWVYGPKAIPSAWRQPQPGILSLL